MVTVDADGHVLEPRDTWQRYLEHLGAEQVIWASDYPHIDASSNVVDEIRGKLAHLPEDSQRKVLGENALGFYGLSFQSRGEDGMTEIA